MPFCAHSRRAAQTPFRRGIARNVGFGRRCIRARPALLTTLAFALGFAEFVLIGITPDVAEGLDGPLTLIGDLVGYYAPACAVATPTVAPATECADASR